MPSRLPIPSTGSTIRVPPRRPLGVDAIVDVAVGILDAEGVEAVSMRRVAAEFGTGPASLYAHVAHKDELLQLVHDRVIGELQVPPGGTWQDQVRGFAHGLRDVYRRHNDVARLSFGFIPTSSTALDVSERLLAAMIAGGVPPRVAGWTLDTLSLFVAADAYEGWLLRRRFTDGSGRDPWEVGHEYFAGVASAYAQLPVDRYPVLVGHLDAVMGGNDDERFAFGLDLFIDGIAARVPAR